MTAADLAAARAAAARAAAAGSFAMPRRVRTPRLTLAPLGNHLTDDFVRFFADEESSRFVGGPADGGTAWTRLAQLAGQWALHGFGHYALHDQSGEFVGYAGLWFPCDWPEIEVGYALMPEARGFGYASEAVRAIHALAMELGAPALVSYIHPDNEASKEVARSAGAVEEGRIELSGKPALVFRYPTDDSGAVPALDEDAADAAWEAASMPLSIRTPRLTLCQWRSDHFERAARYFGDAESTRYIGGVRTPPEVWRGIAGAAGHWILRGYGVYAVEAQGRLVGGVGLSRPLGWPDIELVWSLTEDARGKGYASEAAKAVRAVAAEQGMCRLASFIHPDNTASVRVAERLGATRAGEIEMPDGAPAIAYEHPMDAGADPGVVRDARGTR